MCSQHEKLVVITASKAQSKATRATASCCAGPATWGGPENSDFSKILQVLGLPADLQLGLIIAWPDLQ